jgi:diguanylate cyclase (GGDEF)-like protein
VKQKKRRQPRASKKLAKQLAGVEARERQIDAKDRTAAERLAVVEARERAADARDKALTERDGLANERDRRAAERDGLANERDRRAAEREAAWPSARAPKPGANGSGAAAEDDEEDPALERARLEAQLQRAHLDGLTGAYRREVGRLALRNEIERARRSDGRFVIAFIDVDGLKGVNDREGHAAGDKVLRTLAATMRANLRTYDPIVRYGGDEFVCGVASIDPSEVQHRIGVIDQSLRHSTGVGITAGLASMVGNESLEELTERADAALLEAKRSRDN